MRQSWCSAFPQSPVHVQSYWSKHRRARTRRGLHSDCDLKAWGVKVACSGKTQYFEAPGWNIVEDTNGAASVISRRFGEGQVILLADSRMLNNGSLLRNRRTRLIAYLLEQNRTVIFDEEHLGVTDSGSVGLLVRRYRLYGLVAAALLVFALFIWRNSSTFLPREERRTEEIIGRDTSAGMANLLRRTIPEPELISAAISEWAKAPGNHDRKEELTRIALSHKTPVDAYRAISRALSPKKDPLTEDLDTLKRQLEAVRAEIGKVMIGQEATIDHALVAILAGQHALLKDRPVSARPCWCGRSQEYSGAGSPAFSSLRI